MRAEGRFPAVGRRTQEDRASFRSFSQPKGLPEDAAAAVSRTQTRLPVKSRGPADQQKDNALDRDLTQRIRRALVQDKSLSSYAHNVKVITQGLQVTLKGPVRSEDEKQRVEQKATEMAGAGHVTNQMSVAPKKS